MHTASLAPLTSLATTIDPTLTSYLNHMAPWALHTIPTALAAALTASLSSAKEKSVMSPQQTAALHALLQCMGRTRKVKEDAAMSDTDAAAVIQAAPQAVVLGCLHAASSRDDEALAAGGQRALALLLQPPGQPLSDSNSSPLLLQLLQGAPALHASLAAALHKAPAPSVVTPLIQQLKQALPPLPATTAASQPRQWSPVGQLTQSAAPPLSSAAYVGPHEAHHRSMP